MVVSAQKSRAQSEGLGVQGSGSCDSNDMLPSLLATATVALDTDRRTAKTCIQRAAALLGIDLSSGGDRAAERSCQGGLALWQAKLLRSYIEDKLDSRIRATDLAGVVQLSTSHFFRAFRKTFRESPLGCTMQRGFSSPTQCAGSRALPRRDFTQGFHGVRCKVQKTSPRENEHVVQKSRDFYPILPTLTIDILYAGPWAQRRCKL